MARLVLVLLSSFAALGAASTALPPAVAATAAPASAAPASAAATTTATATQLTVTPAPGTTLTVDGRPYAGDVVVAPDAGGVDVVNRVGFEQYVDGIGEMPSNWPAAALQAQAVAARTYALWTVLTHPAGAGGSQICATDSCQEYTGLDKPDGSYGANWAAAVKATQGLVLQYGGRIIEALYGSSDGGQTLYGGVPWLPAVADPQDDVAPEHQWAWSASLAQMAGALGVPAGQALVSLVSSSRAITETRRAANGTTSTAALTPDAFHTLINARMPDPAGLDLPLPSYRYSVSTYGDAVRIAGWGDGDGLGLSQYGALGKAEAGWTAGQILADYYAGTTPAALPAGEMPATISVSLTDGVPSSAIGASGPVRIVDPSGRTLVTTTGAAGWAVQASGGGITLAPTTSVPVASPPPAADTAPIPQRAPAPTQVAVPPAPSSGGQAGSGGQTGQVAAAQESPETVPRFTVAATGRGGSDHSALTWALLGGLILAGGTTALVNAARRRGKTRSNPPDCPAVG